MLAEIRPGVRRLRCGPRDGRATFELVTVDGELRVRWRRVGNHDVFKNA